MYAISRLSVLGQDANSHIFLLLRGFSTVLFIPQWNLIWCFSSVIIVAFDLTHLRDWPFELWYGRVGKLSSFLKAAESKKPKGIFDCMCCSGDYNGVHNSSILVLSVHMSEGRRMVCFWTVCWFYFIATKMMFLSLFNYTVNLHCFGNTVLGAVSWRMKTGDTYDLPVTPRFNAAVRRNIYAVVTKNKRSKNEAVKTLLGSVRMHQMLWVCTVQLVWSVC